jgi:CRP-like cAMP-binding protein
MVITSPTLGRQVPCEQCPLRAKTVFRKFSSDELGFVSDFKSGEMNAEPGTLVYSEGSHSAHLYTLLSGWAFRYKSLPDGRRQILNFIFPGDFLGLQPSMDDEMQHSVVTVTNALLCMFPREKLQNLFARYPSLASDLTWLMSREQQILDEYLVNVGRRRAIERVAFLVLHLYDRAEFVGLARGNKMQLPFTQQHFADALGMSLVHTNKTMQRLVVRKVMRWKGKILEVLDRDELAKIAMFAVYDKHPRPFI